MLGGVEKTVLGVSKRREGTLVPVQVRLHGGGHQDQADGGSAAEAAGFALPRPRESASRGAPAAELGRSTRGAQRGPATELGRSPPGGAQRRAPGRGAGDTADGKPAQREAA